VERDKPVCSRTSGNRQIFLANISLSAKNLFDPTKYAQNRLESSKKANSSRTDLLGNSALSVVRFTIENESKIGRKTQGQRLGPLQRVSDRK
jgi:hypothetical protein